MVRDLKRAWEAGDIGALIGLLDPGVTLTADGGGLVSARLSPSRAPSRSRATWPTRRPGTRHLSYLERTVNGQPGLVAQMDGVTVTVFAFEINGDRISHIWAVRNPGKLRPWTTS